MPPIARRMIAPVALGVLAAAYAWWRVPPAARHRLWAEDGREFLSDSLAGRPFWTSYDGYLHVVPRLLADAITGVVEVGDYAVAATAVSVAAVGLVCALTYALTADLLETTWVRVLVALVPVLLPAAGVEVIGNLANLHAFGLWLALWLVLHRPSSWMAAWAWAATALLVGLSEIAVILLVPLFWIGWRDRVRWVPRAALLVSGTVQLVVSRAHPRPVREPGAHWSLPDVVVGFIGQAGSAVWSDRGGIVGASAVIGLVVLALVLLAVRRRVSLALALGLTAGLVWSAGVVTNYYSWMEFASWSGETWRERPLLRYATTAGMFLLALVLVSLDGVRGRARWLAGVVVVGVLVASFAAYRPDAAPRERGEAWPTQASFRERCAGDPDGALVVGITPDRAIWTATVPCSAVR